MAILLTKIIAKLGHKKSCVPFTIFNIFIFFKNYYLHLENISYN